MELKPGHRTVLRTLATACGCWMSQHELPNGLGETSDTDSKRGATSKTMRELHIEGLVEMDNDMRYRITDSGREALQQVPLRERKARRR